MNGVNRRAGKKFFYCFKMVTYGERRRNWHGFARARVVPHGRAGTAAAMGFAITEPEKRGFLNAGDT